MSVGFLLVWVGPGVRAGAACDGRTLAARDGSASGLTDCQLAGVLERARLREHLDGCIRQVRQGPTRVTGTLRFGLDLHPSGGLSNLRTVGSAFDKTGLSACFSRVLRRRLAGAGRGKPAAVEIRVTLPPGPEDAFGFSLTGSLVPRRSNSTRRPARFTRAPEGLVSSCRLGRFRMFLRLDPVGSQPRSLWAASVAPSEQVEACLQHLHRAGSGASHKSSTSRLSARTLRRQVTACLVELLEHPSWSVRAEAAEELARDQRWRGRQALERVVIEQLTPTDCAEGRSNRVSNRHVVDESTSACPLAAPARPEAGHALVRMLLAQLSLRREPAEGVLAALAQHPARDVRLRLVDTVFDRWYGGLPEGLMSLVRDPNALVRSRAQQIGCVRGDWYSLNAFREALRSESLADRATAVINAQACARRAAAEVVAAAREEPNMALGLLMLRSVPTPPGAQLLEQAGPGLYHLCPLVRYLACRLLSRLPELPEKLLRNALERESDPVIRQQLQELLSRTHPIPQWRSEQLWVQLDDRS